MHGICNPNTPLSLLEWGSRSPTETMAPGKEGDHQGHWQWAVGQGSQGR